jgi:hypothetical protein
MKQLHVLHQLDVAGMRCQAQGRVLTSLKQPLFSTISPQNCLVSTHPEKKVWFCLLKEVGFLFRVAEMFLQI